VFSVQASGRAWSKTGGRVSDLQGRRASASCGPLRVCEKEGSVQLQEVRCTKVGSHAKPAMREEIARALVQLQLHTLAGFTSLLRDREA